jgi:hypothetical protein
MMLIRMYLLSSRLARLLALVPTEILAETTVELSSE